MVKAGVSVGPPPSSHMAQLLVLLLLLSLSAACAPRYEGDGPIAPGEPARLSGPKRITAAIFGVPPVLDSRFDTSTNKVGYNELGNLYNSKLTVYDDTGTLIPQLAEAVPTLENGNWKVFSDNTMETLLTIKQGARWHDGHPITTRDVLFHDEVYNDKDLAQSIVTARTYVDRMSAIDDRTVSIHWKQPFIDADVFASGLLPAHLLEESYRQNNVGLMTHPYLSAEFVGTGPFKLKQFNVGSSVDLSAFDQYVLGRPHLDEIQVLFIVDSSTTISNVLAGAVDLTMGRGISNAQAVQMQGMWDGKVDVTPNNWIHMFAQYVDPVNPVITDKRFHKALMHSLNRQEFVDTIQFGFGGVGEIPLAQNDPLYDNILARVPRYPYDPTRAAQMFQEVGLVKGPDGYLQFSATGQKLEPIELRTTQDVDLQLKLLASMSNYFRQAGMDMIETVIPTVRAGDRPYRVSFPGLEELRIGYGRSSFLGWMHSSKVPTPENRYTSGNYPRYASAEWDALIDKYAVTIPMTERERVLSDVIYFLEDNLMDMSIIYDTSAQFVNRRVIGAGAHHGGQNGQQGWNAETWDIK